MEAPMRTADELVTWVMLLAGVALCALGAIAHSDMAAPTSPPAIEKAQAHGETSE
jgi:hypothetical protein